MTALLSIGQVRFEQREASALRQDQTVDAGAAPTDAPPGPAPTGGAPLPGATASARPGASAGTTGGLSTGTPTNPLPGRPPATVKAVPDYGLRTQGVTAKTVKIGMDYNKSGCGGSDALANQFPDAVFDPFGVAVIAKAGTELPQDAGALFEGSQQ